MSGFDTAVPLPTTWQWRHAATLAHFRETIPPLTLPERQTLVDTAARLIADYYVHLPQKQAAHGIDPLARLRVLRRRLPLMPSDIGFHAALAEVIDTLSDLHTNYLLPEALGQSVAFLPLQVDEYVVDKCQRVIVTRVAPGLVGLAQGDEVASWGGVPILRAVERAAARTAGANAAAQRAHALLAMTLRPLAKRPPPDEDWVDIGLRSGVEVRVTWRVLTLQARDERRADSLDVQSDNQRRGSNMLFQPAVRTSRGTEIERRPIQTELPRNFDAAELRVGRVHVGYIRIPTFTIDKAGPFVAEFARLLKLMPRRGLMLDVRDNAGGLVEAGERSLQLLTPRPIEPAPMQFRATPAVLELCRAQVEGNPFRVADLGKWYESVDHALRTGGLYSAALPMTSPEDCNAIGQRYYGPVVLMTSALSYSATDIFAAGFQDHDIGPVLGVHSCTGAGGANVWPFALLQKALAGGAEAPRLPGGAELRVALRRSLRVGRHAGLELEERGVTPDESHDVTRRDLLEGDPDLIAHAARLLMARTPHPLSVTLGPDRAATVRTDSDRLDVQWNGRPILSRDVTPGTDPVIPLPGAGRLGLRGFRGGVLVAACNLDIAVT